MRRDARVLFSGTLVFGILLMALAGFYGNIPHGFFMSAVSCAAGLILFAMAYSLRDDIK